MKKLTFNKSHAGVITTLLILIFLGAAYFLIYLPHNEKQIQEQRFSALQNIDKNIHSKIKNSSALLNLLLNAYINAIEKRDTNSISEAKKYINGYSFGSFKLDTIIKTDIIPRQGKSKDSLAMDSVNTFKVNYASREISLLFSKKGSDKKKGIIYSTGMTFSFEQFIMALLPKDVFDEYIVFSNKRPVYESFPSGISYAEDDTLLGKKNGIASSGFRSQSISGTDYKMFLQPVKLDANYEWIIGGLLSNTNYQKEKNQLPVQMVLLLATVLIVCLVTLPWLKLYQMGSKDRLTSYDGKAAIFIAMLLMSLLFFIFFKYNFPLRPACDTDAKTNLANSISSAIKAEIDTVYKKLGQFDSLAAKAKITTGITNLGKSTEMEASLGDTGRQINNIADGAIIKQVFWLNKNGDEIMNWTADNISAPKGNFKARKYFSKITDHKEYHFVNDSGYYLDQGISWTNGAFRTIISRKTNRLPADNTFMAAMSFNFKCLASPVLPTGYLFAVADADGKVLYHSDSTRNLNENLLKVFSNSSELKSCFDAKAPATFSTKYWGKEFEVQVSPVKGLPYFLVIFEDTVYKETTEMETYSFTFSMLIFFFSFLVFQLFVIFIVSAKKSFFKKQRFDTSWVGPKISCHREYVLASIFNIATLALLCLFFNNSTFLQYLFMLMATMMLIAIFLNRIFAKRYAIEKSNLYQFKKSAINSLYSLFFIIEIIACKMLDWPNFGWLLGYEILVAAVGLFFYFNGEAVLAAVWRLKQTVVFKPFFSRWDYVNSFALMALTRLIISSGVSVVFFYSSSYNYEQNLSIRYKQNDYANRLFNKFPAGTTVAKYIDTTAGNNNGVYYDGTAIKNISLVSIDAAFKDSALKPYSPEERRTIQLLKVFRVLITDKAITENNFYYQAVADTSFFFNHLLTRACGKGDGTVTYRQSPVYGNYLRIQSDNLNYKFPSILKVMGFNNGFLFWLLLISSVIGFYLILNSIIKKLFSLNLPDFEMWKKLDNKILISKNHHHPLFVIGLPGAGKKKYILDKIHNAEIKMDENSLYCYNEEHPSLSNVFIAELIKIPSSGNEEAEKIIWKTYLKKVFDPKNRMIIVNHFEYNIQDSVSNHYKLEFLERLFLETKCKIVILSTIHPLAFLDSAMDPAFKPDQKSVPGQDLERWHVLLGHYRIIVLPMQIRTAPVIDSPLQGSIIDQASGEGLADVSVIIPGIKTETISRYDGRFILPKHDLPFTIIITLEGYIPRKIEINELIQLSEIEMEKGPSFMSAQLIRQETNHTYFLKAMQAPAFQAGRALTEETRKQKFDELAFKLQVSSHYYYMYIWQSLTKEEKFLLYDLAEDNLVNSYDDYNLSMLIAKGVVIKPDGTLKLFNKGFRNFILTAIGNLEAMKIKNQIKDNGNWSSLKNPILLVILAIFAFLLISQEEAFAKLITYMAALGAAVPTLLKLFSLFDKGPQKPV